MNENPEGTPNPLNPTPDNTGATGADGAEAMGAGTLDFVETAISSETPGESDVLATVEAVETPSAAESSVASETTRPASFTESATVASSAMPEMPKAEPVSAMPEMKTAQPSVKASRNVVDPMMRPVSHNNVSQNDTTTETVAREIEVKDGNFDTLAMDEATITELASDAPSSTPSASESLVAKDSIVEPAGKKKKKGLIIAAIIFLVLAIGCGAAAVAIVMMNNNGGDRVSKAIEKILDGKMPSIISAQGSITTNYDSVDEETSSLPTNYEIDFDGTFDTRSSLNKIAATINAEVAGQQISLGLEEVEGENRDIYFKISGLSELMNTSENTVKVEADEKLELVTGVEENGEAITETNCVNDSTGNTNCSTLVETPTTISSLELLSLYSGVFEAVDDEWVAISDGFADTMKGLPIFDNSSACLVNAFGTLPKYSKDIIKNYDKNQFITYSTNNLEISKKKNPLYRLSIDNDKMSAFVNSLSNNGFINELNACVGDTATNDETASAMIKTIFANFPTVYVEIDDNYNITRAYFKANVEMAYGVTMNVTADINLSYPASIEVETPDSYITMSELLNNLMSSFVTQDTTVEIENS